ncbi:MAG: cytochrome b [Wenzhouxiangella sp.]|nr:MAG: cytochrome b [Wenzhouxiangella sp.]
MSIPLRNTTSRYGLVSQGFHWLIVALILFQYTWAWRIDQAEGIRVRFELVTQHKTIGMVVLGLAILRVLWRLFNRPPPLPEAMRAWERVAARAGHWGLYLLIFAVPLSGWMYSSAAGYADFWWGPVSFPSLVEPSETLEDSLHLVHQALAISLGVLALIHALAALRHHFINKDDVLRRMLPSWQNKD